MSIIVNSVTSNLPNTISHLGNLSGKYFKLNIWFDILNDTCTYFQGSLYTIATYVVEHYDKFNCNKTIVQM